jgi:hypothetical protein
LGLTEYVLVMTSAIHVTISHAVTSNFFASFACIAVETEDVIKLVAHLLHANNIVATRAKDATEQDMFSSHFVVVRPVFDLVCEITPMRLKTCPISVITTLVDSNVYVGRVVYVDPVCPTVAVDVNQAEASWVESWVKFEAFIVVARCYTLRYICEIL